jgi:hypothetical protein
VAAAASLFREALTIQRKTLTSDDFRVATTQGLLGAAVAASGRFADAETLLVPAFRVISKRFGVAHPRSQAMLKRVVDLYHAWGKPARAKEYETLMGTSK